MKFSPYEVSQPGSAPVPSFRVSTRQRPSPTGTLPNKERDVEIEQDDLTELHGADSQKGTATSPSFLDFPGDYKSVDSQV